MRAANLLATLLMLGWAGFADAQAAPATAPAAPPNSIVGKVGARIAQATRQPDERGAASQPKSPAPQPAATRAGAKKDSAVSRSQPGKTNVAKGKRDPFVSIISSGTGQAPVCTTGRQCLMISHLVVRGVAQGRNGMLALVENAQRRSYFLRVNDSLFDGQVIAINKDAVVFREKATDRAGRVHIREVVKRVDGKAQEAGIPAKKPAT